jgi:hypothetical protein
LPDTVTVEFSGPHGDKAEGPPLLYVVFSACYGSGAAATVDAPGGVPSVDVGPISAVTLTNGGSGYAKLGRSSPTLSLANKGESAANASVQVATANDGCGLPYWKVSGLTVTEGGSGYVAGQSISITAAAGDTVEQAATGTLETKRGEPTLKATATTGSGATFTVSVSDYDPITNPGSTWGVTGVTVAGTTSGYADNSKLSFSGTSVVEVEQADARIVTGRLLPTVSLSVASLSGSGAQLTATLTSNANSPETWSVTAITVDDGGAGYEVDDTISLSIDDGQQTDGSQFYALVTDVDESGSITSVYLSYSGEYYKSDGIIASVQVSVSGQYYTDGVLSGISLAGGGRYYREDATLTPHVATVNVSVRQRLPSIGNGAVFAATVDDDTSSETFGQIESLTLTDGGEDYLAWQWVYSCDCEWNSSRGESSRDHTVVAWRDDSGVAFWDGEKGCSYTAGRCHNIEPYPSGGEEIQPADVLVAIVRSETQQAAFAVHGIAGTPGVHNGPIAFLGVQLSGPRGGWAYLDGDGNVVVPEVTAAIHQCLPSTGAGATVIPTINSNPADENFGRLSVELGAAGDGYLARARFHSGVVVAHGGPNVAPNVQINRSNCVATFTAAEPITDCDHFSFVATLGESTATVSPGGEITPVYQGSRKCCGGCYNCCPDRPQQVTVTFSREAAEGFMEPPGSHYVVCPAHEVEVVFDLDDLEEDQECGPFVACIPGRHSRTTCQRFYWPPQSLRVAEMLTPSPMTGDLPTYLNSDRTFEEMTAAYVVFELFGIGGFTNVSRCPQLSAETRTEWKAGAFGGEFIFGLQLAANNTTSKVYSFPVGEPCSGSYEAAYEYVEVGYPFTGTEHVEVGDAYAANGSTYVRICKPYTIDIQWQ